MRLKRYIRLQRKSIQRDNESLYFITFGVAVFAGVAGYYWGEFMAQSDSSFLTQLFFAFTFYGLLVSDYFVKLQYKQNFVFPALIKCIPGVNGIYIPYYLLKETTSIWNLYIPVFFLYPVFRMILPLHGFVIAMMLYTGIFFLTWLVGNMVFYLNLETKRLLYGIVLFLFLSLMIFMFSVSWMTTWKWLLGLVLLLLAGLNGYFVTVNTKLMKYWSGQDKKVRFLVFRDRIPYIKRSPFFLYKFLHIRMILRSPVLRYQLMVYMLLTFAYLFSLITKRNWLGNLPVRYFLFSFAIILYPLILNSQIFIAEGAFFDRMVLSPSFSSFLKSRYRSNLVYAAILFLLLLFTFRNNTELYYGLFASFSYCAGVVLPLSFLHIFFANQKVDFYSYAKAWTSQSRRGWGELYMLILFIATFSVVFLINYLFSEQAANHFILIAGLISGLFSHKWLKLLHQSYMKRTRYKHMETYRK